MTTQVDRMTADELARHADPLDDAGTGTLGTARGNLPLDTIDVRATITGLATETVLTQSFRNPYDEPLEATYIFPLPDRAAVTALRMETPDRVVEGVLKEREAARTDYDNAIAAGQRASIAEEERPGVFTMRVGNIMPAERVTVRLTMAGRLPFEDGAATFRFPLVVAPRYIPGAILPGPPAGDGVAPDTDAVPDASRITPPVLLPGFPNPVRLTASVDIDPAGLPLTRISSSLHVTTTAEAGDGTSRVTLAAGDRVNRDFVLRLGFGADAVVGALAVVPDESGATFACTVLPPTGAVIERPRDVVLVLDRSGSMGGWKMVAARRAAARIVDTFTTADRFTVLAFDHMVETAPALPAGLVPATDRNRFRAIEHLATLEARGGTEMVNPLLQAAAMFHDTSRECVIVLVTDGQVGNEDQILHALAPVTRIRVHTVGIDTAVNEGFLRRLATTSGGHCELVESEDRLDEAMRDIHMRIGRPMVTNLTLSAGDLAIDRSTVAPAGRTDLYPGAPVVISGRCRGTTGTVTISGEFADGTPWRTTIAAAPAEHPGLRATWARAHVRDLEDRYATTQGPIADLERRIVAVSLEFGVLCRFTAFVAIDSTVVNEGGQVHRVTQPVEAPQGWDMGRGMVFASASSGPAFGRMPMAAPMAPRPERRERGRAKAAHHHVSAVYHVHESADSASPSPMESSRVTSPADLFEVQAVQALMLLRGSAGMPFAQRVLMLTKLAADVDQWLTVAGLPEPITTALRKLAESLSEPPKDEAELAGTWRSAIEQLAWITGERPRPFWKRSGQ